MLRFFLLCFLLICVNGLFGSVATDGIKQLSLHNRICMKEFFEQAVRYDQAAHVLCFENKPACIIAIVMKSKDLSYREQLALKGWRAFKKNADLFPHPKFIFSENICRFDRDFKVLHIYLINKEVARETLNEHRALFQETLGEHFCPDDFVAQLEKGVSLPVLLHNNEMLLGILLGYGKESAKAFQEVRPKCTRTNIPPPTDTYCRIDLRKPKGCRIGPVVFMGNPHSSEVQQLAAAYEKELEVFWQEYQQSKSHLEMVLEKLCEE